MAVTWSWKLKMGEIRCVQKSTGDDGVTKTTHYTLNIYKANCLCAIIYEFKDEQGKDMYTFWTFFNDFEHLKRCIGLSKTQRYNYDTKKNEYVYDNIYKNHWHKVKLNIAYKDMAKMGELLSKAGFKVELYYKEVK